MTKQSEIDYFAKMDAAGRAFAADKPFAADQRGNYLIDIGQILALIRPPPARLLDLGCGSGWTTAFFARSGYAATGVDVAPEAIRIAMETHAGSGAIFRGADMEQLPFTAEFEVAVYYDSLHHAGDESAALRAAWKALAPGGEIILVEPGRGQARSDISLRAQAQFGVTEKDMPPAHTVPLLKAAGFKAIRVFPRLQYQMMEREPTGGIARLLIPLLGYRLASLLKSAKNTALPRGNGIVLAVK